MPIPWNKPCKIRFKLSLHEEKYEVDFITKPFDPAEIQTKVRQHMLAAVGGK